MNQTLRRLAILLALLALGACATPPAPATGSTHAPPAPRRTQDGGAPTANVSPQRPTLSSDTNVAADGTVELETGVAWDPHDVLDVPISLRFGVAPETEAFLNISPLSITRLPGKDAHGFSDPEIGVRRRLSHDPDGVSTAVQASVKLPVSDRDEGLSTGEADAYVAGIVSGSAGPVSLLGYYRLGALGERRGGVDVEHAAAFNAGLGLTDRLGCYAELAGQFVPEQDLHSVFLIAGMNYVLDNGSVLDWGVQTGLSEDAPHSRALVGWTVNLGRWK